MDELDKLAVHLQQLFPGEIADELARMATALEKAAEIGHEELALISASVDSWTRKVAAFAMGQDTQLDLTEAAAGLLV